MNVLAFLVKQDKRLVADDLAFEALREMELNPGLLKCLLLLRISDFIDLTYLLASEQSTTGMTRRSLEARGSFHHNCTE